MSKYKDLIKDILQDKHFLKRVFTVFIGIALQLFFSNLLGIIDTLMLSSLGESILAAVSLANKVFFIFCLLISGVASGVGILVAQYWGQRNLKNIKCIMRIGLIISILGALFFAVPSILIPEFIMKIFTESPNTIKIGAQYLPIIACSFIFYAISNIYVSVLRNMNTVKTPAIISSISVLINIFLNYIFIFGNFNAPKLGAPGAALATLIARFFECFLMIVVVYIQKNPIVSHISEQSFINKQVLKKFYNYSLPVITNEFIWGLGVTMYSLVYGRMGDNATATIAVISNVEQIFSIFIFGFGTAAAIILGNELGLGNIQKAEKYAKYFILMQLFFGVILMCICIGIRGFILDIFNMDASVEKNISMCIIIYACYIPFRIYEFLNIFAIFRSGGDTKAGLIIDATGVWLIGVPMNVISGIIFKLPITYVYALVLTEEIYKSIICFIHYRKKKWLCNIVSDEQKIQSNNYT